MALRGEHYRDAIRAVLQAFGSDSSDFVFLGSCVLSLYMRPQGGPFRPTIDADVVSTVRPWTVQQQRLSRLCERSILIPDEKLLCRYHLPGQNIAVDVLSPEGMNVGGITEWFLRAISRAGSYSLGDGVFIRAVTPPFFMALKLEAWADRGEDVRSDKDAEDVVAVGTEVRDLVAMVREAGIDAGIAELWQRALHKHQLTVDDLRDLVSYHLHPVDAAEEDRVVETLVRCARGA